jgi:hypothetical protein
MYLRRENDIHSRKIRCGGCARPEEGGSVFFRRFSFHSIINTRAPRLLISARDGVRLYLAALSCYLLVIYAYLRAYLAQCLFVYLAADYIPPKFIKVNHPYYYRLPPLFALQGNQLPHIPRT